jgi:hypothetical protein
LEPLAKAKEAEPKLVDITLLTRSKDNTEHFQKLIQAIKSSHNGV